MPSLSQDDSNKEEQLSTASGEVHALMEDQEVGGDGGNPHHSSASIAHHPKDVSDYPPDATSTNEKSSANDIDEMNAKSDEEVSGDDAKESEEVSSMGAAHRATTKKSSSTNEEILPSSNAFTSKSDNDMDDNGIFGNVANEHGVNTAVDDHLGEENGANHDSRALGTGKSDESAPTHHTHHRQQYNQSFLSSTPSSTQSDNGTTLTRSSRNEKQDEYVKKGARVKALLASALQAVTDGLATTRGAASSNNDDIIGDEVKDAEGQSKQTNADFEHVQDLAQKKSEECITLKRVSCSCL